MAISLLVKYLTVSKMKLTKANLFYLVVVSLIVANKVGYDGEMPTILREFSEATSTSMGKLKALESNFVKTLNYNFTVQDKCLSKLKLYILD